jgi:hypothetical protein
VKELAPQAPTVLTTPGPQRVGPEAERPLRPTPAGAMEFASNLRPSAPPLGGPEFGSGPSLARDSP